MGTYEYSSSSDIFISFLTNRMPFKDEFNKDQARDFYISVRCGLLHEARTKNGWTIWAKPGSRDFLGTALTVGPSKAAAGTGRIIPLNPRAVVVLTHWRAVFPGAQPEHYVSRTRSTA